MTPLANPLAREPRYELVARVLRDSIRAGRLPPGLVLLEGPIAERLHVSRAPVQAALRQLSDEGLILRIAAPHLRHAEIEAIRDGIDADPGASRESLEEALMEACIARAPNASLVQMIRDNRLVLQSLDRALTGFGLPTDHVALEQYRTLFDLIARHPIDAAAEYLKDHLRIMAAKSLARMKIVAVISETGELAPYLTPL